MRAGSMCDPEGCGEREDVNERLCEKMAARDLAGGNSGRSRAVGRGGRLRLTRWSGIIQAAWLGQIELCLSLSAF
eukprot:4095211-Pleurochrysis_carterae.AAC.1